MSVPRCSKCGAELLPNANYCRQCGATVTAVNAIPSSELPTEVLNERVNRITTRRLDPRPTSPSRDSLGPGVPAPSIRSNPTTLRRRLPALLIMGTLLCAVIVAMIGSLAFVRMRSHSQKSDDAALVYPGSQTVVDMTSPGGRAIHLQTGDSLEQVVGWYEASLKPTKTMRLTSTSVVMKNEKVTATIAAEAGKTNILIKSMR